MILIFIYIYIWHWYTYVLYIYIHAYVCIYVISIYIYMISLYIYIYCYHHYQYYIYMCVCVCIRVLLTFRKSRPILWPFSLCRWFEPSGFCGHRGNIAREPWTIHDDTMLHQRIICDNLSFTYHLPIETIDFSHKAWSRHVEHQLCSSHADTPPAPPRHREKVSSFAACNHWLPHQNLVAFDQTGHARGAMRGPWGPWTMEVFKCVTYGPSVEVLIWKLHSCFLLAHFPASHVWVPYGVFMVGATHNSWPENNSMIFGRLNSWIKLNN